MASCAALLALCLFALPGAASAHITGRYFVDGFTHLRTVQVQSDEAADTIIPACSGGSVTLNGHVVTINGQTIACGGSRGPERVEVYGGAGNDKLDLTHVSRAAGFTAIFSDGKDETPGDEVAAIGGTGADTIIGGPLGEQINSSFADTEFGGDTVHGNGGNDRIRGTTIGDRLFGGAGNDAISGETGSDYIRGGPGRDFIDAVIFDKKPDKFYGDSGRDELIGGAANDLLDGGSGNDFMQGNGGKDRMLGRAGNDFMQGGGGADTIFGNAGKDYIRGGPGRDKIHPGAGKDNAKQ